MSVNFTTVDTFKYWCNKILPLVYDDSLSYYEQLCKVVAVLNQVVENVNKLPEYIAELVSDERLKEILTELLAEIKEQVASGNEGDSETATSDRVVGELVWLKGKLYRVIKQMDNGDRYVVDGNVEKVTVESVIDDLKGDVAEYVEVNQSIASKDIKEGELVWYKNELVKCIKDIAQGSGYVKGGNYEVVTVEKLLSDLGLRISNEASAREEADSQLQSALDTEKADRVAGDNQLQSALDTEKDDRVAGDSQLQSALDTEKADRVAGDSQLQSALDTEKADRVAGDNQLQNNIDIHGNFLNGTILLIGDSYLADYSINWGTFLAEKLGKTVGKDVIISALGGTGFVATRDDKNFNSLLEDSLSLIGDRDKVTLVIFGGGYNDTYATTIDALASAVMTTVNNAQQYYTNARVMVFNMNGGVQNLQRRLDANRAYAQGCLNGKASFDFIGNVLKVFPNVMLEDLIHPNESGEKLLAGEIVNTLYGCKAQYGESYILPNTSFPNPFVLSIYNDVTRFFMQKTNLLFSFECSTDTRLDGTVAINSWDISVPGRPNVFAGDNQEFLELNFTCTFNATGIAQWSVGRGNLQISGGKLVIYLIALDATDGWCSVTKGATITLSNLRIEQTLPTAFL